MRRVLTITVLLALAVPAAYAAPPPGKGPQSPDPEKNASKACLVERGTTEQSIDAFNEKYGTNGTTRNAFGRCVSQKVKQAEAAQKAVENAAKKCRTERGTTDASIAAFREKYGTGPTKRNAFGKCVATYAKTP